MFETCTKYFFIMLCSFFLYKKTLNIKASTKNNLSDFIFSLLLCLYIFFLRKEVSSLSISLTLIVFFIIILITYKSNYSIAFICSIISFSLSHFFFLIADITLLPICALLLLVIENEKIFYIIICLLLGIVQLFIASVPFRFKRLKKGMPFLFEKPFNFIGLIVSLLILLITTLFGIRKVYDFVFFIFIIVLALCGFFLFYWWRRQITVSYLRKIKSNNEAALEDKIRKLEEEHKKLSYIIHKDNKLIPAMELAVETALQTIISSHIDDDESTKKLYNLLLELKKISFERSGMLSSYEHTSKNLAYTCSERLNSLLSYMDLKMNVHRINFNFSINADIKYFIHTIIDDNSLSTLLADLLENSIIATQNQRTKSILLSFDIENGHYSINIYDSGILFDIETLLHIGKEQYTSHFDSGGSGIGFMTIFEILKKTNGSIIIDDSINSTIFTKKISIYFDSLNQFILKTRRTELDILMIKRPDIILYKL